MYDQGQLIKKIIELVGDKKIKIAEIGVYKGKGTAIFNVELINSGLEYEYHAIDHFDEIWNADSYGLGEDSKKINYYTTTLKNLSPILNKINVIKNTSVEQSKKYQNEYFDIVYIDGAHDYESVKNDINSWFPKIKKGGIICGDDYISGWPGVIQAVTETVGEVSVVGNQQWFKIKDL
jgi:predicted O-methyltransferase YrrM